MQHAEGRIEIAKLVKAQADGGAAAGLLAAGKFGVISDRLACFSESIFKCSAVLVRFRSLNPQAAGGAAGVLGNQSFEIVELKDFATAAHTVEENGIDLRVNPRYHTNMSTCLVIDKAGRVVIPKPLREELHLEAGDTLEMESAGEQITLRPVRGTRPLTKERGVWVFRTGQPLSAKATDEMLQQIRQERDLANLGKSE